MAIIKSELRGHVLHCILSIDSRVCKSNEELKSAFKVFILHAGHFDSSSFFSLEKHAARQFKQNLFHFRWIIISFYLRRKEIKNFQSK